MKLILCSFLIFMCLNFGAHANPIEERFLEELNELKKERGKFLNEISLRENKCLAKFFSGKCLENLDIDYETGMRDFELRRQNILLERREFRADIREKKRLRRKEKREKLVLDKTFRYDAFQTFNKVELIPGRICFSSDTFWQTTSFSGVVFIF